MASDEGGVEIEEVAARQPEKIIKMSVDPTRGVSEKEAGQMAQRLGLADRSGFIRFVGALYEAYLKADCSLAEINPLVVTEEGNLLALDAKINFDDNALFRHPEYEALRDLDEEDPKEIEAKKQGLSYISLEGNIGCMVNGAGLAMATMDIIKLAGGEPANFLDVGGGATAEQVTHAFKIILADPKVKAVLVNIFGGIMKCDTIAEGIVSAARPIHLKVPVVVRLQGTNVDLGKKILQESGLNLVSEDDLGKAAKKVTILAQTSPGLRPPSPY
jgi:succinyl-CoA synthetase beta subunit